ncbi:penicillin-binding protein 2 [Candidatus Kuenenbacteria bacterium]|nr:penicillin-binding protein 2 [Candidatus Kuenenbacteria bacterium]
MSILIKQKKRVRIHSGFSMASTKNRRDYRLALLMLFFIVFALLMLGRLFKLQIIDRDYYLALASGQHEIFKQLYPDRGTIYVKDKEGDFTKGAQSVYPVAINKSMYLLYAVPQDIRDPETVLGALKEVFEIKDEVSADEVVPTEEVATEEQTEEAKQLEDIEGLNPLTVDEENQLLAEGWKYKLNKTDDPYEPLKHLVDEKEIEKIKAYNLEGIYWTKEVSRYYPEKNIGSQLIGFVGKQAENNMLKGYYGLEGCYNKELGGDAGFLRSELDTFGRWIAVAGKDFRKAEDGYSLVLTIDKSIQYYACDQLNKFVVQFDAEGGSLIAMDPITGEIMAMCNNPDFDPNLYNKVEDISVFNNSSLLANYEPGSVFKPLTMAAALDTGKVDPFTGFQDTGEVKIGPHTIRNSDFKANGWQTMTEVLEKSLNTGAVFAARQVGLSEFKRYIEGFGFGEKTNAGLCNEGSGDLRSLDEKGDIYLATASFGQGITTTPIQLVRAYAAIANEGKLVEPYVVDSIVDDKGNVIQKTEPKVIGQVISPQTARLLGSMLVSVVKSGHAKKAGIPGYLAAGKTGTAQVPDPIKGGYSDKTIHTFLGFAPYNQPKFAMIVKLDNPTAVEFAADSATPLFSKVGKFILDYYEVPTEVK